MSEYFKKPYKIKTVAVLYIVNSDTYDTEKHLEFKDDKTSEVTTYCLERIEKLDEMIKSLSIVFKNASSEYLMRKK